MNSGDFVEGRGCGGVVSVGAVGDSHVGCSCWMYLVVRPLCLFNRRSDWRSRSGGCTEYTTSLRVCQMVAFKYFSASSFTVSVSLCTACNLSRGSQQYGIYVELHKSSLYSSDSPAALDRLAGCPVVSPQRDTSRSVQVHTEQVFDLTNSACAHPSRGIMGSFHFTFPKSTLYCRYSTSALPGCENNRQYLSSITPNKGYKSL